MPEDKGVCFVICPIGEEGTPARKRSDDVLELVVRPAAEELGYRAERTIEAPRPGWITERIVRYLLDSPMVVADLSGRNPNVFYELAIRHMVRKPFVQIMQAGEEVPFDVLGLETIFYEYGDWSSAAAARKRLVDQMHTAADHPDAIRTPVSIAGDLAVLQGGEAPTGSLLRDLLDLQRETVRRLNGLGAVLEPAPPRRPSVRDADALRSTEDEMRLLRQAFGPYTSGRLTEAEIRSLPDARRAALDTVRAAREAFPFRTRDHLQEDGILIGSDHNSVLIPWDDALLVGPFTDLVGYLFSYLRPHSGGPAADGVPTAPPPSPKPRFGRRPKC